MAGSSNVQEVLDRMVTADPAGPDHDETDSNKPEFVASSSWQGLREGYYFGTGSKGTGYYVDNYGAEPKKRKRSVKIQLENNEMRLYPADMLAQAEKQASGSVVVELTQKGIHSSCNALSKIVQKNSLQRAKFADDPQQYMESELALYEQLTALQAIASNVQLYQYLIDNETFMSTLTQLLTHENADVAASVVALFLELLDPTLLAEDPTVATTLESLANIVLTNGWETVVANLTRFGKKAESEGESQDETLKGVENVLSLQENLLDLDMALPNGLLGEGDQLSAAAYMVKETQILSWLFQQINAEDATLLSKGRCMELLSLVSQREDVHSIVNDWAHLPAFAPQGGFGDEGPSSKKTKQDDINGIELLLQTIGGHRKSQPTDDMEVELLENACIALSSCITFSNTNLATFLDGQGIELVLRCLKERVHSGGCSLKLLDFFGGDKVHKKACDHLVKAGGLKYLFPMFLSARLPKPAPAQANTTKAKREWLNTLEAQTIRVMYALARHLDDDSPEDAKGRFLTKFVQDDKKCDRLVELLLWYDERSRQAEYNFYRSDVEEEVKEEENVHYAVLAAKLKGGGDLFHRLGVLAAFVCVNSKRCHQRILSQLQMQQSGISLVKAALEEFMSILGPGSQRDQLESYMGQI